MQDLNRKFVEEVARISTPEIFLGVARILKVKLVSDDLKDEDDHPCARDFEEICADVIEAYAHADRHRKRELLHILKKANEVKEAPNAD